MHRTFSGSTAICTLPSSPLWYLRRFDGRWLAGPFKTFDRPPFATSFPQGLGSVDLFLTSLSPSRDRYGNDNYLIPTTPVVLASASFTPTFLYFNTQDIPCSEIYLLLPPSSPPSRLFTFIYHQRTPDTLGRSFRFRARLRNLLISEDKKSSFSRKTHHYSSQVRLSWTLSHPRYFGS